MNEGFVPEEQGKSPAIVPHSEVFRLHSKITDDFPTKLCLFTQDVCQLLVVKQLQLVDSGHVLTQSHTILPALAFIKQPDGVLVQSLQALGGCLRWVAGTGSCNRVIVPLQFFDVQK